MQPQSAVSWQLVTPPDEEPVDLDTLKRHLYVDHDEDDAYIEGLGTAARSHIEEVTGRALVTQGWKLVADSFPHRRWGWPSTAGTAVGVGWQQGEEWYADRRIPLQRCPLASVESVVYVAADGTATTLATSEYIVDTVGEPGRIVPGYGKAWPIARRQPNAVTVNYTVGYGAASDVPQPFKQAIMLLVGHWYQAREAVNVGNIVTKMDFAVDALLAPYKVYARSF